MKTCKPLIVGIPAALLLSGYFLIAPSYAFLQDHTPETKTEDFRISTNVDLVLLDVSVKDSKGGYVSNLTKENFTIEENGVPQKIATFLGKDVPVSAGLVLDASGSMRNKRQDVNTAGLAFVNASNPQDQIFVVDFNDKVRSGLPDDVAFTDDVPLLRQALNKHPTEGRTALYDAIASALKHLDAGTRDKKTLLVVSDGGDNASRLSGAETMRLIEESHATIYTIGLFDPDDVDRNPGVLRRIAAVSGGECFLLDKVEDIVPTGRRIAQDIRKRYTIGYIPDRGNGKLTGLRKVHVTALAPDHGKLIVRTRASYIDSRLAAQSKLVAKN
ncbi:MAG: VWA domain-containing protein [Acidobacteriota bacterium]|nr:VWA domain-containing protein [Acidobacteriota bacterium]